jgi:hypothetical protein
VALSLSFFVMTVPASFWFAPQVCAQTTVSGDIAGTITDPTGAVIPGAHITLTNTETGATRTATSGSDGVYRFALLPPDQYTVNAAATGFQASETHVTVNVGTGTAANLTLQLGSSTQTIQVTTTAPLLQTQNANLTTTFSTEQIQNMPNPGNDITFMGQLAPGSVVNSTNQAANGMFGYGNFSSFGLPATSNNFTVNGTDENDPFFNVNNSGATNLLLGNNEIAEDSVTSNAYSAQFGGLGGAQLNEITRSGTNQFHGNLVYWWNGRILNANSYFNNQQSVPRPFVNDNQWAASIGGPIFKNKLFFFLDTEGIRFIFPTSNQVFIPSASYQTSVLGSVTANNPSEVPYYQHLFSIYNNAPGASGAIPYAESGVVDPDVNTFRSTASSGANEWLLTGRLDYNIGTNDKVFGRYKMDRGFQPSYTDPLNSAFDLVSTQPSYEGQMVETHSFTPNIVNQFLMYGSWYSAIFEPPSVSADESLFYGGFQFQDQALTPGGTTDVFNQINPYGYFFNGRNITQYGVEDDLSLTHGAHTIRVGWNLKRDDVSDWDPLELNYPVNVAFGPGAAAADGAPGLTFNNGYSFITEQDFPLTTHSPIAMYQMGAYLQDDWSVRPNFKLDYGIRFEHNSNPICVTDCFSRLSGDPYQLGAAGAATGNAASVPYNSLITAGQAQTFSSYQAVAVEPRVGFTFSPPGQNGNLVIRAGFGLFSDVFPGTIADSLLFNPPNDVSFTIIGGLLDPSNPASGSAIAADDAKAFRAGFANGGSATTIAAAAPTFAPINFTTPATSIHYPTYEEWSLQVQRQFGRTTAVTLGYVGNHGFHEPVQENSANAYGFPGLPATAPLPSFSQINLITSEADSNYNGGTATVQHREKYVDLTFSYTYSHALDEISNGGFLPFNPGNTYYPENPYNLAQNYGNADYDVRHNVTGNYVILLPSSSRMHALTSLWQLSGTVFFHTGFPYSVVDTNTSTGLQSQNYYGTLFADQIAPQARQCSTSAVLNFTSGTGTPCLNVSNFASATGFGQGRRNAFFGPHYFDTDFAIQKGFGFSHHEGRKFTVGAQLFNILNHPNFAQPVSDINSPLFGLIDGTVSTPTSIFGSGLGGDASPRIVQMKGTFQF